MLVAAEAWFDVFYESQRGRELDEEGHNIIILSYDGYFIDNFRPVYGNKVQIIRINVLMTPVHLCPLYLYHDIKL